MTQQKNYLMPPPRLYLLENVIKAEKLPKEYKTQLKRLYPTWEKPFVRLVNQLNLRFDQRCDWRVARKYLQMENLWKSSTR